MGHKYYLLDGESRVVYDEWRAKTRVHADACEALRQKYGAERIVSWGGFSLAGLTTPADTAGWRQTTVRGMTFWVPAKRLAKGREIAAEIKALPPCPNARDLTIALLGSRWEFLCGAWSCGFRAFKSGDVVIIVADEWEDRPMDAIPLLASEYWRRVEAEEGALKSVPA